MLPSDPGFHEILQSTVPPGWLQHKHQHWGESAIAIRANGIAEIVSFEELDEYLEGGEYEQITHAANWNTFS